MKLSIWQQFSSNHSSGFTIVGEFPDRTTAERAADEIRSILKMLTDWHAVHQDEMQEWWSGGNWVDEPSPPEKDLAAKYNLEWKGAVDWFASANVEIVLDRLVFITPINRPEADGKPFDQLIDGLGGKGYHDGNVYGDTTGWILFTVTCEAPDEASAVALRQRYLGLHQRVRRNGSYLNFYRWHFEESLDLPTLMSEIAAAGCTGISYRFEQRNENTGFEIFDVHDLDDLFDSLKKPENHYDYAEIADILGEIGDPRAVEPLIELLSSSDDWARHAAAHALAAIGDLRAIPPLTELLDKTVGWQKSGIKDALNKLNASQQSQE